MCSWKQVEKLASLTMLASLSILLAKLGARKMKYAIATAAVLIALAAPAFADQPNGTFNFKTNQTYDQSNVVGRDSSQITQNGQFIGGTAYGGQTNSAGERSGIVQGLQAQQGRGSANSGK
jgi:hypothetical protein